MIISFAWTTEELVNGNKTVTRREWKDSHAEKFEEGSLHEAWDQLPYAGGEKVAKIRILSVEKESLRELRNDRAYGREELKKEGGLWETTKEFVELFDEDEVWRIEFELVAISPFGMDEYFNREDDAE